MGKTRDLFKKIRDTNGTFHAKMGSKKDRNGMDLTEAEDIKKRWQEYWSGLPFPSPGKYIYIYIYIYKYIYIYIKMCVCIYIYIE